MLIRKLVERQVDRSVDLPRKPSFGSSKDCGMTGQVAVVAAAAAAVVVVVMGGRELGIIQHACPHQLLLLLCHVFFGPKTSPAAVSALAGR